MGPWPFKEVSQLRTLRKDTWGFATAAAAGAVIGVVVAVIIALALVNIVANTTKSATTNANLTTDQKSILSLTPTFYVLGAAILAVGVIFVALHEALKD